MSCVYCGNQVVWADVMATTEGQRTALTADSRGLLALEEKQQYIHMGRVCAPCCDDPASTYTDDYGDDLDPYEGLSESDMFFVMDMVELKGWDIETARAAVLYDL